MLPGLIHRYDLSKGYGSSGSRMWGYGLDRAGSGQGQVAELVNAIMNIRVP